MATQEGGRYPHFILTGTGEAEPFRPPGGGSPRTTPPRNRSEHGAALKSQVDALRPSFEAAREAQEAAGLDGGFGLQVEFESFPEVELAFESLAAERSGIELLNIRHDESKTYATVFMPDGKLEIFERKIAAYLDESRDGTHGPRNQRLLDAIRAIRTASLRALWTDTPSAFPESEEESFWWEVWLPVRMDRAGTTQSFQQLATYCDLEVAQGKLDFPERTVLLVKASAGKLKESMMILNSIAELRRAKETAEFFDVMPADEQAEWVEELLQRTTFSPPNAETPHVCLMDTGVNHLHPLITPATDAGNLHTLQPGWGVADDHGHGTELAGLALWGELTGVLESAEPIDLAHRLESVKLLRDATGNEGSARHHGFLTVEAVARPEVSAPQRSRIFAMAITARDGRDRGIPSAWSAAVDGLASDADGLGESPRLIVLAAGNVDDPNAWREYPESNSSDGIHDPGQAWNALTVGAYTELVNITEADAEAYAPIAPAGGLSPFSTTSSTWAPQWPLKPDVVFEGGNVGVDPIGAAWMHSLSLLTTHHDLSQRAFTTSRATSAATALGARMAARIMGAYPTLWPETVRALLVHSASWTPAMRENYLPTGTAPTRADYARLIRHCGFGVPDLERARWTLSNAVTMVIEDRLRPFQREEGKQPTLRDMHLHSLPWPLEELEALGETDVEMRVTLSYFIEPNPSQRGVRSRYRYESCGLRFDVKRPAESADEFRARVNVLARDEEAGTTTRGGDSGWIVGPQTRHRGSIHSDIWRGRAADLASRGQLAVYPTAGWWKTRPKLERYDLPVRYSLLVSIRAPDVDVDLQTAIANQIAVPVTVET